MSHQVVETLKEFLRIVLIAVIPVVIDGLQTGVVNWQIIAVAAGVAALRALDKFLHEGNVATPLDLKGLDVLKG
jgi:hypothetical protein